MTDSNATELLRKLLDERGVEWRKWTKGGKRGFSNVETVWFVPYSRIGSDEPGGFFAKACNGAHGRLQLTSTVVSPEQAVDATLGRGECENLSGTNYFHCSECDERTYSGEDEFNFCPNCGRVVNA